MTGIEIFDRAIANDEHVLTQVYITPKRIRPGYGFKAWYSFWSDGGLKNLNYFAKPAGIREKLINDDSAITKIVACLRAGCSIKFCVLVFKKISIGGAIAESRFNLKLAGTEVILEPVA